MDDITILCICIPLAIFFIFLAISTIFGKNRNSGIGGFKPPISNKNLNSKK